VIILDTNVLSELLTPTPSTVVIEWLSAQHPPSVFTTAVTEAEILYGLRLLPEGRRRRDLEAAISPIFDEDLSGRVLPFDRDAADLYATMLHVVVAPAGPSVSSMHRSRQSLCRAGHRSRPGMSPISRALDF
jgi:predicted nucleic acid-binding protein